MVINVVACIIRGMENVLSNLFRLTNPCPYSPLGKAVDDRQGGGQ